MPKHGETAKKVPRNYRPATNIESREQILIGLAYDLVEERLLNGTATSQETTHFLKLGSSKELLEREMMKKQNEMLAAKTEALKAQKRVEDLYTEAIAAFKEYRGTPNE